MIRTISAAAVLAIATVPMVSQKLPAAPVLTEVFVAGEALTTRIEFHR